MNGAPCPLCRGACHELRGKLVCGRCGRIVEGCCEGGPPPERQLPAIRGGEPTGA